MRKGNLLHMRTGKVKGACAVLPEPLFFTHTIQSCTCIIGPCHEKTCLMTYANNHDTDQIARIV